MIWEPGSEGRLGSHTKGCVSMKSAPEEKVAAQSFVSSFPHFVRIMKKFNVSGSYTLVSIFSIALKYMLECLNMKYSSELEGFHNVGKLPFGNWVIMSLTLPSVFSG